MGEIIKGQILQTEGRPRLKECPFCGCEAEVICHRFVNMNDSFGVRCLVCKAESWQFYGKTEEAVYAWNRRQEANRSSCVNCAVYKQQKGENG